MSTLLLRQCLACLVRLIWMVLEWMVGNHIAAALWNVASRICSLWLVTFLCNCCQASSPCVVPPYRSMDTIALWKNLHLILSDNTYIRGSVTYIHIHSYIRIHIHIYINMNRYILKIVHTPNSFDGRCNLCLEEKIHILIHKWPDKLLNKRSELIAWCRHMTKSKL